jgi:hypothetical protein
MFDTPPAPQLPAADSASRLFRRTLLRVIAVQLAALLLLWLLQIRYSG